MTYNISTFPGELPAPKPKWLKNYSKSSHTNPLRRTRDQWIYVRQKICCKKMLDILRKQIFIPRMNVVKLHIRNIKRESLQ